MSAAGARESFPSSIEVTYPVERPGAPSLLPEMPETVALAAEPEQRQHEHIGYAAYIGALDQAARDMGILPLAENGLLHDERPTLPLARTIGEMGVDGYRSWQSELQQPLPCLATAPMMPEPPIAEWRQRRLEQERRINQSRLALHPLTPWQRDARERHDAWRDVGQGLLNLIPEALRRHRGTNPDLARDSARFLAETHARHAETVVRDQVRGALEWAGSTLPGRAISGTADYTLGLSLAIASYGTAFLADTFTQHPKYILPNLQLLSQVAVSGIGHIFEDAVNGAASLFDSDGSRRESASASASDVLKWISVVGVINFVRAADTIGSIRNNLASRMQRLGIYQPRHHYVPVTEQHRDLVRRIEALKANPGAAKTHAAFYASPVSELPDARPWSLNIGARLRAGLYLERSRPTQPLTYTTQPLEAVDAGSAPALDDGINTETAVQATTDHTAELQIANDAPLAAQHAAEASEGDSVSENLLGDARVSAIIHFVSVDMDETRRRGRHPVRDWPDERADPFRTMNREAAGHIADRVIANLQQAQPELIQRAEAILARSAESHMRRASDPDKDQRFSTSNWAYADIVPDWMREAAVEAQRRINLGTVACEALLLAHLSHNEIHHAERALTAGIYDLVRNDTADRITNSLVTSLSSAQRRYLNKVHADIRRYVHQVITDMNPVLSDNEEADLLASLTEQIGSETDQLMTLSGGDISDTYEQYLGLRLAHYCQIPALDSKRESIRLDEKRRQLAETDAN